VMSAGGNESGFFALVVTRMKVRSARNACNTASA
jgi:hypothetical protein